MIADYFFLHSFLHLNNIYSYLSRLNDFKAKFFLIRNTEIGPNPPNGLFYNSSIK